ncbi:MAG TPA: rod shape-determining protein MreD [Acidimicrobiia bacterium]|nr:rod shape-determining protein MreD [Acidimicrobiia bacterium]
MTAPAVVRRWNDPPVRVGRGDPGATAGAEADHAPTGSAIGDRGGRAASSAAVLAEQFVRLRRVAPAGAVLLTALVLHSGVVPHLTVRDAAPDVLLVAVVAMAAARGSRAGAGFGFVAGLGADVFLATPVGTSALAYTLLGHVLGAASRPLPLRPAAHLCRPGSTCFSCRTGRPPAPQHPTDRTLSDGAARPSRARRRAAARRAAFRRSIVLTGVGVAAGRLGAALVGTTLGGAAFPGVPGVGRMAAVAALSAPLGPAAAAAVQRLVGRREGPS